MTDIRVSCLLTALTIVAAGVSASGCLDRFPREARLSMNLAHAGAPRAETALILRLPVARRLAAIDSPRRFQLEVRSTDLDGPLRLLTSGPDVDSEIRIGGIPTGVNRLLILTGLTDAGQVVPGASWAAVVTLEGGYQEVRLSPLSTAVGLVWRRWLDTGRSDLAAASSPRTFEGHIDRLKQADQAAHYALLDLERWADEVTQAGTVPDAAAGYARLPGRVAVTLDGVPEAVPADIWIDDPVSPKQSGVSRETSQTSGRYDVYPVAPGTWNVWASVPGLGVASRSLIVESGATVQAALDFGGWVPGPSLPAPIGRSAVTSDGRFVYVAGGISADGQATASVWVMDAESASPAWLGLPPLPKPVEEAVATVFGGRLFVSGGYSSQAGYTPEIVSLPLSGGTASGSWSIAFQPDLNAGPVYGETSAPLGSISILNAFFSVWPTSEADGQDLTTGEVVELVTAGSESWTVDPPGLHGPRITRRRPASATLKLPTGIMWILAGGEIQAGRSPGGLFGEAVFAVSSVVEELNLWDYTWRSLPDMPTARSNLAAAQAGPSLYAVGGVDQTDRPLRVVERFDTRSREWHPAPPMRVARSDFGLVYAGSRLWAIGGSPSYRSNWQLSGRGTALSSVEALIVEGGDR